VSGVQEPGVVRLGEALALVLAGAAAVVHSVDEPGRWPGLTAISAATEARLFLTPVTRTTGVWPRRPQVQPLGGLRPWPDSSSKTSQAPKSAAVLL
jgi:hypothetical protein